MDRTSVGIAAVLVIVCVMGTVTTYLIGSLMVEDRDPLEYIVSGTGPDGSDCTGTAVCTDTGESAAMPVLEFSFRVSYGDVEDSFRFYLFLDADGLPVDGLYTFDGTGELGGEGVDVWRSISDPDVAFLITASGDVLGVEYTGGGYDILAQATP